MGRGRGRGRGKASVTAAPVASAVYPVSDVCYETVYDGVDDSNQSSDAGLKIAGAQTWCCEFYIDSSVGTGFCPVLSNINGPSTAGLAIYSNANTVVLQKCTTDGAQVNILKSGIGQLAQATWYTCVGALDNTSMTFHIDAVSMTGTDGAGNQIIDTATTDFYIAGHKGSSFGDIKIRNVEIYSGKASNPTAWVPGNTGSLSGVSLVMQSKDGGSTIETSQSFVESGDPTRQLCT